MDKIYIFIIIFVIMLMILELIERRYPVKEQFCNQVDNTFNTNMDNNSSINFNSKKLNFKNFSTNGKHPPFQKCPSCRLDFDCTNYPYTVDDNNVSVCTNCIDRLDLDGNHQVLGRSAGRPRICRNLT